jgi:hypothetical protein
MFLCYFFNVESAWQRQFQSQESFA